MKKQLDNINQQLPFEEKGTILVKVVNDSSKESGVQLLVDSCNQKAAYLLGVSMKKFLGMDVAHDSSVVPYNEDAQKIRFGDDPYVFYRFILPTQRYVKWTTQFITPTLIYNELEDQTSTVMAANHALEFSNILLHDLYEDSPISVVLCSSEGYIEDVNEAYLKMMGITAKEYIITYNQLYDGLISDEDRELVIRNQHHTFNMDFVIPPSEHIYKAGEMRHLRVHSHHLYMNDGTLRGYVFFAVDITYEREAKLKAEQAERLEHEFVANMTHEFRTPLNVINGFVQLLCNDDEDMFSLEEKREIRNQVQRSTDALTYLLNDVLTLSRLDAGTYKMQYSSVDLLEVCLQVCAQFQTYVLPGNSLTLAPVVEGQHFVIFSDRTLVTNILNSYVSNAVKHAGNGNIILRIIEINRIIKVSVEDHGPGIPEGDRDRLFDRFTKLNQFKNGTGLGLAICKESAKSLGAKVYLDADYTEGARFVVEFPL